MNTKGTSRLNRISIDTGLSISEAEQALRSHEILFHLGTKKYVYLVDHIVENELVRVS